MQPVKLEEFKAQYQQLLQRLRQRISALQDQLKVKDESIRRLEQYIKDCGLTYPQYKQICSNADAAAGTHKHSDAACCDASQERRAEQSSYAEGQDAATYIKCAIYQELFEDYDAGVAYLLAGESEEAEQIAEYGQNQYSPRKCVVSNNFESIAAEILSFVSLERLCTKYGEGAVKLVAMGLPEAFWLHTSDGSLTSTMNDDTEADYLKLCGFLDAVKQNVRFFDVQSQSADLARSSELQFISFESLRRLILTKNGKVDDEQTDEVAIPADLQRDVEYVSKCLDAGVAATMLLRRGDDREMLVESLREAGFRVNTAAPDIIQILNRGTE